MTSSPLPPPIWVDTPQALAQLVADVTRWPQVAVDTESNSLHAYQEQVCLIQISTPQRDYLIDPLALRDLSPLAPLFADPKIEKIFHAAGYDLLCLRRDFGFTFDGLFDTMLAARILGQRAAGLDVLLLQHFNVQLDKRYQKADWAERPLSAALREYARLDTHYLIPLRDRLARQLQEKGRWELAQEDFHRLALEPAPRPARRSGWERLAATHRLTSRQRVVLQALWEWRERIASQLNRPTFKVVSNATLVELTRILPHHPRHLAQAGLSPRQIRLWGEEILQVVAQAQQVTPPAHVRPPAPDESLLGRLERLKDWRKRIAQRWDVESDVILPRPLLEALAVHNPQTLDELRQVLIHSPWRFQAFGEDLLAVLQGVAHPDHPKRLLSLPTQG